VSLFPLTPSSIRRLLYASRRRRRTDIWPRLWRRHPLGVLVAIIVLSALAWDRARTPFGTDYDRYHNRTFACTHVVDGDTLDIDAPDGSRSVTRVRLWGVDTPETVKPDMPAMYFGPEASAYSRSQALGRPVRLVLAPDKTRDRYDRLLAYVYLDGRDATLNESLIAGGYAYADSRFPHAWQKRFARLEATARKNKLGLWANVRPEQMPEWRQHAEARPVHH
jgi:micrococcal nuclease